MSFDWWSMAFFFARGKYLTLTLKFLNIRVHQYSSIPKHVPLDQPFVLVLGEMLSTTSCLLLSLLTLNDPCILMPS